MLREEDFVCFVWKHWKQMWVLLVKNIQCDIELQPKESVDKIIFYLAQKLRTKTKKTSPGAKITSRISVTAWVAKWLKQKLKWLQQRVWAQSSYDLV